MQTRPEKAGKFPPQGRPHYYYNRQTGYEVPMKCPAELIVEEWPAWACCPADARRMPGKVVKTMFYEGIVVEWLARASSPGGCPEDARRMPGAANRSRKAVRA